MRMGNKACRSQCITMEPCEWASWPGSIVACTDVGFVCGHFMDHRVTYHFVGRHRHRKFNRAAGTGKVTKATQKNNLEILKWTGSPLLGQCSS